jgi:oxygen-independent coproporphyrinogen-3 oxidase
VTENWRAAGFGVYLHWPFCEAICPYCDFNVRVAREVDDEAWGHAFARDIDAWAARTPGRTISSIYLGGGTPSLMSAALVGRVLAGISAAWTVAADAEITIEANPTSAEAGRLRDYHAAGVTRFSLGLQALDDADLKVLGRRHSAEEGLAALRTAAAITENVSFDLIYARPHQSIVEWRHELERALQVDVNHCSLYELTIEPGTPFGHRAARGRLRGLPDEERAAGFYDVTGEICRAAGFARYEVSSYARHGARSRHNQLYWKAGDWIGIGPGAYGRVTLGERREEVVAHRDPTRWLAGLADGTLPHEQRDALDREGVAEERMVGGLRTSDGLDRRRLTELGFDVDQQCLEELQELGLLDPAPERLRVTDAGFPLGDAIAGRLVPLQPVR